MQGTIISDRFFHSGCPVDSAEAGTLVASIRSSLEEERFGGQPRVQGGSDSASWKLWSSEGSFCEVREGEKPGSPAWDQNLEALTPSLGTLHSSLAAAPGIFLFEKGLWFKAT